MLKIYLARHGQDQDNAEGVLNGRRDNPLTDIGIKQANVLAEKIGEKNIKFDAIYSSPLKRTLKTAEIVRDGLGMEEVVILEDLVEREFGIMTGKMVSDIEEMCAPDVLKTEKILYFLNPKGAETFDDLMVRSGKLLSDIKERHKDGAVLLVTHGDIGMMIYATYYNLGWREVLKMFYFDNSDLLILTEESAPEEVHAIRME